MSAKSEPYTRGELEAAFPPCVTMPKGSLTLTRVEFDRLISTAKQGAEDAARLDAVVMDAIEQTIRLCDLHEREDVPHEERDVDYARILASAKRRAGTVSTLSERRNASGDEK